MRARSFVLVLLSIACSDSTAPNDHRTHAMVGLYGLNASFATYTIPGPVVSTVNASFTGSIFVGDSVVYEASTDTYLFPIVQVSGVCCAAPGSCSAAENWTATTALAPNQPVLFDFAHALRLEGPWSGNGFSGSAMYVQGTDARNQYTGSFTATRK